MTDKARGSVCPVLMLLVFLLGTGLSQDLRRAWGKYVSVDAQLAVALAKQKGLSEQQKDIQKQMGSLKGKQSWFNGWITEIVLARKSAAIVDLADSLQATQ
ncbi:MAG: hypothetical protein ACE5GH_04395, partial [Fidelibacterota bacterium]